MSLRSKIVLILVVVGVLYAALDNVSLRLSAEPRYEELEKNQALEELGRIEDRIGDELDDLHGKARLYAGLEGVRRLVSGENNEFSRRDLDLGSMTDAELDVAFFCGKGGQVLWGEILDPETHEPISLTLLPKGGLRASHPVLNYKSGEDHLSGLMTTARGPLLVAAVAVGGIELRPDRHFRSAREGSVVLGRFLTAEELGGVLAGQDAELRVHDLEGARSTLEDPAVVDELTGGLVDCVSRVDSRGRLQVFRQVPDLRTGDPLVLEASLGREIHHFYRQNMNHALVSALAGACLLLFDLLRLLRRIVIHPLTTLTRKAVEIGRRDDTTIRVDMHRDDEIGQLAGEFDSMLEKLARSRAQVVKSARLAGMSEIATGVLHNVGNVLNSVNVSTSLVSRKVEQLSTDDLEKMVTLLRPHADDFGTFVSEDPRGKYFLPFLFEVTESLVRARRDLCAEVEQLGQGIEHIAELVRSQQDFAVSRGVFEMSSLEAEIDSSLHILEQALGKSGISIVREFEELPSFPVDRHRFMEIIVNLLQNARQALDERGDEDKRIALRLKSVGDRVRLEVEDNGVGISQDNLDRVFQHGFTTKDNGHGFGLHVSANAATEMGGSLTVASRGLGWGATFVLELPLKKELTHAV